MKTVLLFVVAIAIAGFLVNRFFIEGGCAESPVTHQCVGTTTGYESGPTGGGGGGSGGGGGVNITLQVP